ncbi:MAG: efflux RND transporter periplasmic adaptor subunit [Candidatus Aminicenantes bacterium]
MMKKKLGWILLILVLIFISVFLIPSFFVKKDADSSSVKTVPVVRRDIGSSVLATGIVKPMIGAEVKVGSRVSGVVKRLRAQIGDMVEAGQVIAELDESEFKARLDQNIAALRKAEADLEYSKVNLKRQKSLLEKNFTSRQQVDMAENAYKTASAQVSQAKANVEYAEVQLGYTKIYAPISGVIASISTQEGETVAASLAAPTFVNLIDLTRLEVQTYVDETDIGKINTGLEAVFTVDTFRDTDFEGKVKAIYPKAVIQDNVVNYIVTVEITDFKDKILRPEMTASVTIYLETRKNVLAVPASAITRERGEYFVTVLENGNQVRRNIRTGWRDGGYTEIISGLEEKEYVVISE